MNPPPKPSAAASSCAHSRFQNVFSGLFLGGQAICLGFWLYRTDFAWTSQTVWLCVAIAVQAALYVWRFIIVPRTWRSPLALDVLFFIASLGLWLLEVRIDYDQFWWLEMVYVGFMFAVIPWWLALPTALVTCFFDIALDFGWEKIPTLPFDNWFSHIYRVVLPAIVGLMFSQLNSTGKKQSSLIEELQAAKQALELAHDREVELAALRERERLARDLHDTLGHQLVTMTVQLEAAMRLVSTDPARTASLLADTQKLSRASIDELRRSLDNLRASGLGDQRLGEALSTLCAEMGRNFGLKVDCELAEGTDNLPPTVAEVLWRVAQEGLTNIGRHAQAHHVSMKLSLQPREIILSVADDGIGWPPGAETKPGH